MAAEVKDVVIVKQLTIRTNYYTTPAAASTGYILITSEDGISRKVMIQA